MEFHDVKGLERVWILCSVKRTLGYEDKHPADWAQVIDPRTGEPDAFPVIGFRDLKRGEEWCIWKPVEDREEKRA